MLVCSSVLHAVLKIQIRAGPRMAQRLEVVWQITVPLTGLPAASDNDVLILPLQRITNDPLPYRTGSNPHKSHVYIMKLSLTQPIKKNLSPKNAMSEHALSNSLFTAVYCTYRLEREI